MRKKLREAHAKVRDIILDKLSKYNLPEDTLIENVPMKKGQIALRITKEHCVIVMIHKDLLKLQGLQNEIATEVKANFSDFNIKEGSLVHTISVRV